MLQYEFVDGMLQKRDPFRGAHLEQVEKWTKDGKLILGGAYSNPVDGGALVFDVASAKEVEDFAKEDPYVKNGLVTKYSVREWNVVKFDK